MIMLIKITENNGLETYVNEPRLPVAINMIEFFKNEIGLGVESVTDDEPLYSGVVIDYTKNLAREVNYKMEFNKFADTRPLLRLVK